MPCAIGLNSGSSFDGVDAVLVEIDLDGEGGLTVPRFVHGLSLDWPEEVRGQVLAAFSNDLSLFDLTRLNCVVGGVFAEAAMALMKERSLEPADVDVIGYDGQTLYQEPPEPARMAVVPATARPGQRWATGGNPRGLQVGEPGVVAVMADVPTVTQFGSVDHALGGTGAPLMQFLDHVAFRAIAPIATLDIGGVSNLQVANADAVIAKYARLAPADLVATFTQFTASAIVRALVEHVKALDQIEVLMASGGGTRNGTLMRLVREQLPAHVSLALSDAYGLPSQFKEAIRFATLAFATLHGIANNIPAASGARACGVMGKRCCRHAPRAAFPSAPERRASRRHCATWRTGVDPRPLRFVQECMDVLSTWLCPCR
jgi:anhydro-N-acetylmuramic acid kinase